MTPNEPQPQFGSTGNDIREAASREAEDTLESARRQLNDMMEGLTDRAREYGRYADETVQQNPWMAVGIGFGVGVVMGALLMMAASRD
jgi:ElaB/YqjD/DUF883 family membrane-anchored ribosome-binding protein